jgi:hypothetical protein
MNGLEAASNGPEQANGSSGTVEDHGILTNALPFTEFQYEWLIVAKKY